MILTKCGGRKDPMLSLKTLLGIIISLMMLYGKVLLKPFQRTKDLGASELIQTHYGINHALKSSGE